MRPQKKHTAEWWFTVSNILFAAITALATVAIYRATNKLADISAEQRDILDKTDQTSRLRDRAFVYFLDPAITPYPPQRVTLWGIGIPVQNAGNMPARRLKIRYACVDFPRAEQILDDPFPPKEWVGAEVPNVVGPKNGILTQGCNIPLATIEAAKLRQRDVFILFEATYLDGFAANERLTRMTRVLRWDGDGGGPSIGFAGPHNCSDDDCPK